jgi:hypothetical protein
MPDDEETAASSTTSTAPVIASTTNNLEQNMIQLKDIKENNFTIVSFLDFIQEIS